MAAARQGLPVRLTQYLYDRRPYPVGVARAPVEIDLKISTHLPAGLLDVP
jgi:hypothetical protein